MSAAPPRCFILSKSWIPFPSSHRRNSRHALHPAMRAKFAKDGGPAISHRMHPRPPTNLSRLMTSFMIFIRFSRATTMIESAYEGDRVRPRGAEAASAWRASQPRPRMRDGLGFSRGDSASSETPRKLVESGHLTGPARMGRPSFRHTTRLLRAPPALFNVDAALRFQRDIDAIRERARRRHSALGSGASLPAFAGPRPAPAAKPPHCAGIDPLGRHAAHYAVERHPAAPAPGTIKKLFRQGAKAVASEDEDKSKSRQRRRRGETEGQFRHLMRRIMRRLNLRPEFRNAASKAGRPKKNSTAPETFAAGSAASPWSNPLSGMDCYAGDLAGFNDSDDVFDNNLDQVSLDL